WPAKRPGSRARWAPCGTCRRSRRAGQCRATRAVERKAAALRGWRGPKSEPSYTIAARRRRRLAHAAGFEPGFDSAHCSSLYSYGHSAKVVRDSSMRGVSVRLKLAIAAAPVCLVVVPLVAQESAELRRV